MNPTNDSDYDSLMDNLKAIDHKIESLEKERNGLKISLRNSKDDCASLRRQLRAKGLALQPKNKHKLDLGTKLAKCNALVNDLRNKNNALQKDKT